MNTNTSQSVAIAALAKWMKARFGAPQNDPDCYHVARAAFRVLEEAGFRVARKPRPRYPKALYSLNPHNRQSS